MAVQGNLLGSSDLTRFVQAAQGNRPKSLGQIAEERRKERVAAERDLLKFAADLRLKRLDLKDAMEQRAAQTDIQRQRLKLEETDKLAQASNMAAQLAIKQRRLVSDLALNLSKANNKAEEVRLQRDYNMKKLKLDAQEASADKLNKMQGNFLDAIKITTTGVGNVFGSGSSETFISRPRAKGLFDVIFAGLTDDDFKNLNIDKKEFTFDNYFGNTFYGKVDGKGNSTDEMMSTGDAQSDAIILQSQTFPSNNEAGLQSLGAGKFDFNE